MNSGIFITFEGSEGSGKSTQIELACEYLKKKKKSVVLIREPGGVPISESIRDLLLDVKNKGMSKECEMLLYMSARAQLVDEIIIPELKKGKVVICDRFLDSTLAYQGYGHEMDIHFIKRVGKFVTQDIKPHLTFILDIDAQKGLNRIKGKKDRIEQRALAYHKKVREGYLDLARKNPRRIKVINSDKSIDQIHQNVIQYIQKLVG